MLGIKGTSSPFHPAEAQFFFASLLSKSIQSKPATLPSARKESIPHLRRHRLRRQDLDPPRINFHHMHDRVAENNPAERFVRRDFRSHLVAVRAGPQHDHTACDRQGSRWHPPDGHGVRRSTDGSGDLGPGFETEPEVELGLGDGGEETADAAGAGGGDCVEVK